MKMKPRWRRSPPPGRPLRLRPAPRAGGKHPPKLSNRAPAMANLMSWAHFTCWTLRGNMCPGNAAMGRAVARPRMEGRPCEASRGTPGQRPAIQGGSRHASAGAVKVTSHVLGEGRSCPGASMVTL